MVEVRPVSEPEYTILGKVPVPWYQAVGLKPGVEYLFRVKSINPMGPSEQSAELDKPVKLRPLVGKSSRQSLTLDSRVVWAEKNTIWLEIIFKLELKFKF